MRNEKARQVALSGVLFALAMALSFLESTLAPIFGLMPGVKIGLANVVVMYALFFMGRRQALLLVLLKSFFVMLTRGVVAGGISLAGGLLSLLVMVLLTFLPAKPTLFIFSVCGAVAHNMGQLAAASLMLTSAFAMGYAPVLLISGLIMGAVTSMSLRAILPALKKLGFQVQPKFDRDRE